MSNSPIGLAMPNTKTLECFQPLTSNNARILILGSMPGTASLEANQYYAHPRNAFWPIMQHITNVDANADYKDRLHGLQKIGIDLWDVIANCERKGSLDADIKKESICINDFATYFAQSKRLELLALNGGKAFSLFKKHVLPITPKHIKVIQLPSTSPAYASMCFNEKKDHWLQALNLTY